MQNILKGYILKAEDSDFAAKDGTQITGVNMVLYDEATGETQNAFVRTEDLKGFNPKQLAKITGTKVEANFRVSKFDQKLKLQEIKEI